MSKDQIFIDAVNKCQNGKITREFISQILTEDKTNTIRKELSSFGIVHLALTLEEVARNMTPPRVLLNFIDSHSDNNMRS